MNGKAASSIMLCVVLQIGLCLMAAGPAFADAWAASWGRLDANLTPSGPDDQLVWNEGPEGWLLYAEVEVSHLHPPLTNVFNTDTENLDPSGDGIVSTSASTGCLADVDWVEARVAATGGPYADINSGRDVYSYAHDIPNSYSHAQGFAQHGNIFWIEYTGTGEAPADTTVNVSLAGPWNLEGDSDPDDNWWASWHGYAEVYDMALGVLGNEYGYYRLDGPDYKSDSGTAQITFAVQLEYQTQYAFHFWLDCTSYAEAVPEPATLGVLLIGGFLGVFGRRRRA